MTTIMDFRNADPRDWILVNDGVMGGLSTSRFTVTKEGTAVFSGAVSLENNGGFASTRAPLAPPDLSGCRGVVVRARGDGRGYQLRFRTQEGSDGLAYKATFDTKPDVWQETFLPFQDFRATFRGQEPPDAPPLDTGTIKQVGFLIADRREGAFRLEVAWLKGR